MKTGIELVAEERNRQIKVEGYTAEHDSQHKVSELISAAIAYANSAIAYAIFEENGGETSFECVEHTITELKKTFVWGTDAFKPKSCLSDVKRSAALLVAAIDRLQNIVPKNRWRKNNLKSQRLRAGWQEINRELCFSIKGNLSEKNIIGILRMHSKSMTAYCWRIHSDSLHTMNQK